jgi:hypothetical protein
MLSELSSVVHEIVAEVSVTLAEDTLLILSVTLGYFTCLLTGAF